MGRDKSAEGRLVERSTAYVMLFALEKPTAEKIHHPGSRQGDGAASKIHHRNGEVELDAVAEELNTPPRQTLISINMREV